MSDAPRTDRLEEEMTAQGIEHGQNMLYRVLPRMDSETRVLLALRLCRALERENAELLEALHDISVVDVGATYSAAKCVGIAGGAIAKAEGK